MLTAGQLLAFAILVEAVSSAAALLPAQLARTDEEEFVELLRAPVEEVHAAVNVSALTSLFDFSNTQVPVYNHWGVPDGVNCETTQWWVL